MTVRMSDFRLPDGTIDKVAYERAKRAARVERQGERAAEARERAQAITDQSDVFTMPTDGRGTGRDNPIRYRDVRKQVAEVYDPFQAMWIIRDEGGFDLSWHRPEAVSFGRRVMMGEDDNILNDMDGGALGGSANRTDFMTDLAQDATVSSIGETPKDSLPGGTGEGWLGLFEYLLPEQVGSWLGSSSTDRYDEFLTTEAKRAISSNWDSNATWQAWSQDNPELALRLLDGNDPDRYTSASSPFAMQTLIMKDLASDKLAQDFDVFRNDSGDLEWLAASVLSGLKNDVATVDTLRTVVLQGGVGSILSLAGKGLTTAAKAGSIYRNLDRVQKSVGSSLDDAGRVLTATFRPQELGLAKYALATTVEGAALMGGYTDRTQRDAIKMAQLLNGEQIEYNVSQTVQGTIMGAVMGGVLGTGLSFGAPAAKGYIKTGMRYMFDQDYADRGAVRRNIEDLLVGLERKADEDPLAAARRLADDGDEKFAALVKEYDELDGRLALKDGTPTELRGSTAEAIAAEGTQLMLRREIDTMVRRLVGPGMPEGVDLLGDIKNINRMGTNLAEVHRMLRGLGEKVYPGQQIPLPVIANHMRDFLLKASSEAGEDLATIATRTADMEGLLFRELLQDSDGNARFTMSQLAEALNEGGPAAEGFKSAIKRMKDAGGFSAERYVDDMVKVRGASAKFVQTRAKYAKQLKEADINIGFARQKGIAEDSFEMEALRAKRSQVLLSSKRELNELSSEAIYGVAQGAKTQLTDVQAEPKHLQHLVSYMGVSEAYGLMASRSTITSAADFGPDFEAAMTALMNVKVASDTVDDVILKMGLDGEAADAMRKALSNAIQVDGIRPRDLRSFIHSPDSTTRDQARAAVFSTLSKQDERTVKGMTGLSQLMSLPVFRQFGNVVDKMAYFATGANQAFRSGIVEKGVVSAVEAMGSLVGQGRFTKSMITGKYMKSMEAVHEDVARDIADTIQTLVALKLNMADDATFNKANLIIVEALSTDGADRSAAALKKAMLDAGTEVTDDQATLMKATLDEYMALTDAYKKRSQGLGADSFVNDSADIGYLGIAIKQGGLNEAEYADMAARIGKRFHERAKASGKLDVDGLEALGLVRVERGTQGQIVKVVIDDDELRDVLVRRNKDFVRLSGDDQVALIRDVDSSVGGFGRLSEYEDWINGVDAPAVYNEAGKRYVDNLAETYKPNRKMTLSDIDPLAPVSQGRKPRVLTQEEATELGLFRDGLLDTDIGSRLLSYQTQMFDLKARELMRDHFGIEGIDFRSMAMLVREEMEAQIQKSSMSRAQKQQDMQKVDDALEVMLEKYSILAGRYVPGMDSKALKQGARAISNVAMASSGAGFSRGAIIAEGGLTGLQALWAGVSRGDIGTPVGVLANAIKGAAGPKELNGTKVDARALRGLSLGIRRFLTNSPSDRFGLDLQTGSRIVTGQRSAIGQGLRRIRQGWSGVSEDGVDKTVMDRIVAGTEGLAQTSVELGFLRAVNDALHSGQASLVKIKFHDLVFKTGKKGKSNARRLSETINDPDFQAQLKKLDAERAASRGSVADELKYEKKLRELWQGQTRAGGLERFDWNDVRLLHEAGLLQTGAIDTLERAYKALPADMQIEMFDVQEIRTALRTLAGNDEITQKAFADVADGLSRFIETQVTRNISEPGIWTKPSGSFASNEAGQLFFRLMGWARGWYENYIGRAAAVGGGAFLATMGGYMGLEALHQMSREYLDGNSPEAIWHEYEANPVKSSIGAALSLPFLSWTTGYAKELVDYAIDFINDEPTRAGDLASKVPALAIMGGLRKSIFRAIDGARDGEATEAFDLMRRLTPGASSLYSELLIERLIFNDPFGRQEKADRRFRRNKKTKANKAARQEVPELPEGQAQVEPQEPKVVEANSPEAADPVTLLGRKEAEEAPDGLFK